MITYHHLCQGFTLAPIATHRPDKGPLQAKTEVNYRCHKQLLHTSIESSCCLFRGVGVQSHYVELRCIRFREYMVLGARSFPPAPTVNVIQPNGEFQMDLLAAAADSGLILYVRLGPGRAWPISPTRKGRVSRYRTVWTANERFERAWLRQVS